MWTRLMDLVMLVAEISQGADRMHVELDKELSSRGYSADEIEHAVFWFSSRPERSDSGRPRTGAVRVPSDFERMSLSTGSLDYLYRLLNLGIVDWVQFETILAQAIPVGAEKVRVEDVKQIACSVIFDRDAAEFEDDAFDRFDAGGPPV
jgi:uncharacterized protein Smg (DUF494 family)